MIKNYLRNSFYLTVFGGVSLAILKNEKIMDYSADVIENYTSTYVENRKNSQTIDEEKSYIKLLVKII